MGRISTSSGDDHEVSDVDLCNEAAARSKRRQRLAGLAAYTEAMQKAGVLRGGERLRPTATATTVRVPAARRKVLNGPYAETKEQLGGYYMIDVPDLDAALAWAARCPGAATARSRCGRSGRCRRGTAPGMSERCPGGRRSGGPAELRQARRLSRGAHPRCRGGRGRAVRRLRGGAARWPASGVPRNPEAWLMTVARRRLIDAGRRRQDRARRRAAR